MRNWTNIGADFSLSTIYRILERLETESLVEFCMEEVDNRERKVYKITDKGSRLLKKEVFSVLNGYIGRNDENYYVAFSMFPILSKEEQVEAFSNSIKKIVALKQEIERMLETKSHQPLNVTGLFTHPIEKLRADIDFLEGALKTITQK